MFLPIDVLISHEHPIINLARRALADGELEGGRVCAPIYLAVAAGDADKVAIRLPKEIAMRLLMILTPNWADEIRRVL